MLYDKFTSMVSQLHSADPHAVLRENGCYIPGDDDVFTVFQTIARISVMKKLAGDSYEFSTSNLSTGIVDRQHIQRVWMEELVPQLAPGKTHTHEVTGNGFEWSGWYGELNLLLEARILQYHDGYFFLTKIARYMIEHEGSNTHMLRQYVMEECSNRIDRFVMDIQERIRRFRLEEVVLAAAFVHLAQRKPA